jgi:hypothetical protein
LRQRVQSAPVNLSAPVWVDDPQFDIHYHVRHVALPKPGSLRQLLDYASLVAADPFDRTRPLWQFVVVDGLRGGKSALIEKLHHTIADGEGSVQLSLQFLDFERDAPEPPPIDRATAEYTAESSPPPTDVLRDLLATAEEPVAELLATLDAPAGEPGLAAYRDAIDFHFGHDHVEAILASLDTGDDWAREQAAIIRRMSPTSCKLTLAGLRLGRDASIEQALVNEYRMVCAIRHGHDFFEGVRAQLLDKDRNPKWAPASFEAVTDAEVARYLVEPESGDLTFE